MYWNSCICAYISYYVVLLCCIVYSSILHDVGLETAREAQGKVCKRGVSRSKHCLEFDFEYSASYEKKLTPFEAPMPVQVA